MRRSLLRNLTDTLPAAIVRFVLARPPGLPQLSMLAGLPTLVSRAQKTSLAKLPQLDRQAKRPKNKAF